MTAPLAYDVLSLDIGSSPKPPPGVVEMDAVTPVKPVEVRKQSKHDSHGASSTCTPMRFSNMHPGAFLHTLLAWRFSHMYSHAFLQYAPRCFSPTCAQFPYFSTMQIHRMSSCQFCELVLASRDSAHDGMRSWNGCSNRQTTPKARPIQRASEAAVRSAVQMAVQLAVQLAVAMGVRRAQGAVSCASWWWAVVRAASSSRSRCSHVSTRRYAQVARILRLDTSPCSRVESGSSASTRPARAAAWGGCSPSERSTCARDAKVFTSHCDKKTK